MVAVKEASGNISQIASVVSEVRGSDFKVYKLSIIVTLIIRS